MPLSSEATEPSSLLVELAGPSLTVPSRSPEPPSLTRSLDLSLQLRARLRDPQILASPSSNNHASFPLTTPTPNNVHEQLEAQNPFGKEAFLRGKPP